MSWVGSRGVCRAALLMAVVACLVLAGCGGHKAVHAASTPPLHGGRTHAAGFGAAPSGDYGLPGNQLTAVQILQGYDAVTLSAIPHGPSVVGCYVSGSFANCDQARADFPHAVIVTIATYAGYPGSAKILDTEPGDAVPSQDAGFIRHQLALGVYRPGVYADSSEMGEVEADLRGIPRADYTLFLADWDGNPAIPAGFDAKQWLSTSSIDRDSFTAAFFAAPAPSLPLCIHKREAAKTCSAARAQVASDQRALASSQRAAVTRGCPGIAQRRNWFYAHISRPPASKRGYRTAAYQASRAAYLRQGCSVFEGWQPPPGGRVGYFTGRIRSIEAAN